MSSSDDPTDEEVVQTAAAAADDVIFSRLSRSDVEDLDINVSFEDGVLDVDVYLNTTGEKSEQRVAEDAALAARAAVDDLLE